MAAACTHAKRSMEKHENGTHEQEKEDVNIGEKEADDIVGDANSSIFGMSEESVNEASGVEETSAVLDESEMKELKSEFTMEVQKKKFEQLNLLLDKSALYSHFLSEKLNTAPSSSAAPSSTPTT